ncbi:MAG TPA: hypothetical protein VGB49_04285 [Caulobacteraceae bacterium]|jgi:hypothetical protein
MDNARKLTLGFALLAAVVAAGAAWATQSWMPLVMIAPIALIVVVNSGPRG